MKRRVWFGNLLTTSLLLVLFFACSALQAQQIQPLSEESVQKIRLIFVQQYGTPAQVDALMNHGKGRIAQKLPKLPKNPQSAGDMAAVMDYQAYAMKPEALFDYVYEMAVYNRYGPGLMEKINAAHPEDEKALAAALWRLEQIPMPEEIYIPVIRAEFAAFEAGEKKVAAKRERQESLYVGMARVGGSVGLAGAVLNKEQLQELVTGSLRIRAQRLFDVVQSSLDRQPQVSAYVLSVSDTYLPGPTARDQTGFLDFERIYPDDPQLQHATLRQMSEPGRCQILNDALRRFVEQGHNSFQDTKQLQAFLRPFLSTAPPDVTNFLLSSAGPESVQAYEAANADQRQEILTDALAYYIASELLFKLSVSDERFAARPS